MPKEHQKFVISQKGMIMRGDKCLIVQLAQEDGPSSFKWDLPGGRIDEGEQADIAFKREILEETGIENFQDLGVADHCIRYPRDTRFSPYCGIIHLLKIADDAEVKLSFEHINMKWIGEDEIGDFEYCWKMMPEMIKKGFELYGKIK
jgi:8-oxo-dGTP diphosphatase